MKGRAARGLLIAGVLVAGNAGYALTAANSVASSHADDESRAITADDLKPAECSAITLSATTSGSGVVAGSLLNDLLLGSSAGDTLDGLAGDDCILGGGGDDAIEGSLGYDICLGGGGTDTFAGCEETYQD